jgi:hypothetical protein
LAACWIAAGALLWRTKTPSLQLEDLDPSSYFSASDLDRAPSAWWAVACARG